MMELKELLTKLDFEPNPEQLKAIKHTEGPLLITAGPGSGKTEVLVFRTLHLLLEHGVRPSQILVCTFTEKAAATLKDRLTRYLRKLNREMDLTELWVGTVHSICNNIIDEYLDRVPLVRGYEVLDDLTQLLFLHEHYYEIIRRPMPLATGHWASIEEAARYFDRITEERIDPSDLLESGDNFLERVGTLYERYEQALEKHNAIDFAHLQSLVLRLLDDPDVGPEIRERFRYVMVDEYQDTNYIQEQLFLRLTEQHSNLVVVGDEDQALYRFRGATVQNILQFPDHFESVERVSLNVNYRSTPSIIGFVSDFIHDGTWEDDRGRKYRYEKDLQAYHPGLHGPTPSAFLLEETEPDGLARFIRELEESGAVSDLNQIAILLRSVKYHGPPYFRALEAAGIPFYCPRAQRFLELRIVRLVIGMVLRVLDFDVQDCWNDELKSYYERCLKTLSKHAGKKLEDWLGESAAAIRDLGPGDSLKKGIVDVFYEGLAREPFLSARKHEVDARSLAMMSDYLTKFQEYYHLPVVRGSTVDRIRKHLFNSYLYALWREGLNEYEDPYDIFPKGHVQIMTIHQAKGLEFPVVVVGSLDRGIQVRKQMDRRLKPYRPREEYEPEELVTEFDHYRLFYVAFSRAMDVLVLSLLGEPHHRFVKATERADALEDYAERVANLELRETTFRRPKPEYSVAGDIHVYEVCPQQYLHYNEYGFIPSRGAGQMFGTLVHRTIEDAHKHYLREGEVPDDDLIETFFDRNVRAITRGGVHPLGETFRELAEEQVFRYVEDNRDRFQHLVRAEEPVSVDQGRYIITGSVDLVRGEDGNLELIDFKAQERPPQGEEAEGLEFYRFQLALYAHLIGVKLEEKPKRTYIYWTAEEDPENALQLIPSDDIAVDHSLAQFDKRVSMTEERDFEIREDPQRDVCRNCDLRYGCSVGHRVLGWTGDT